MPILAMWYRHKIESIELFLTRAFRVNDEYARAFRGDYDDSNDHIHPDKAFDAMKGYQDIVFKAIFNELNALIELELKMLAKSVSNQEHIPSRESACRIIESHYKIQLKDLSAFRGIDEIRQIANAYKHDDGFGKPSEEFPGRYEETIAGAGSLLGYRENRFPLDWENAYQAIQATKEFMQALPGERQRFPESRRTFKRKSTNKKT